MRSRTQIASITGSAGTSFASPWENAKGVVPGARVAIETARQKKRRRKSVSPDQEFSTALVAFIPALGAYSFSLCRNRERADDLVQETLCKAWQARDSFRSGSNLIGWLKTILHNQFCTDWRVASQQRARAHNLASEIAVAGAQISSLLLADAVRAIRSLPSEQREAVILISLGGLAYTDAAVLCNCPIGTVKSRVGRARKTILTVLNGTSPCEEQSRPAIGCATQELLGEFNRFMSATRLGREQN
jgi:RNA polymerase sigma-70 factor (ECF subfamily)